MAARYIPCAIAYDFDGTLAPGNMQEHSFIPAIGMSKKRFWKEVTALAKQHNADNILVYMGLMLEKAQAAQVPVRKEDFIECGRQLTLFKGVETWFDRITAYGRTSGIRVEHYIISSGIKEMIEGTPVTRKFKAIFASSFRYDHHGIATWPALALNYTTKTQYVFRINKGSLKVHDHTVINRYVPESERPVPFDNIVFIGDGETDIPCFRLVKDKGGHSVAVYKPHTKGAKAKAEKLIADGRVSFIAPADYREKTPLDKIVKGIIEKLAVHHQLRRLTTP